MSVEIINPTELCDYYAIKQIQKKQAKDCCPRYCRFGESDL